ncbi:MAG TPA: TonB-dependent receptor [Bryobacteraceae bacterium]|nr:TonB-dependent receptor [Bryobacteraceae bacterium]
MRKESFFIQIIVLGLLLLPAPAWSQRLCIAVKDPQGLPVNAAAIRVEPLATSAVLRGVTGEDGEWCADTGAGVYVVRAFGSGMEGAAASVTVEPRGEQRLSLALRLSTVASQIEVTASRLPESLLDAPLPVRQVDAGAITQIGARQLTDALQEQPEVVTFAGGTMSGGGSTNVQGFASRDVEILVDGEPLTGRVSGYVDLNQFDASMFESVEIKTGASAMTYGQQGMGGAINLITKRAGTGSHASVETGYGSFNTGLLRADGGYAKDGFAIYAAGAAQRSLGYDLESDILGKTQSANRMRNLFSSLYLPQWKRLNTGLTFLWTDQNFWGFEGSTVTGIYDFERPKRRLVFLPRASLLLGSDSLLTVRGRKLYYRSDENLAYRDPLSLRPQSTHNEANGGDVEWSLARSRGFRLSTGLFFNRQSMVGDRINTEGNRAETDVWSQVTTAEIPLVRSLRLMAGYRADHDTNFGGRLSPQAALAWKPFQRLSLSASVTRGMRAPDFNELYILHTHGGGRVRILGDPNLRPQKSWSYSASALTTVGSRTRVEARLFDHDMTDLIQTSLIGREGAASVYLYGNVGQARIRGGSTSYRMRRIANWN